MRAEDIGLGKTWEDLVRDYFPEASKDECDYILWEETCFPFGSIEQVEKQIKEQLGASI